MTNVQKGRKRPAIFIDRDGVIVDTLDYLSRPDQVVLTAGIARAIADVNLAGIPLIMITNQSGIARGFLTESDLSGIHVHLKTLLAREHGYLDAIYYCPHHPDIGEPPYRRLCECRKPAPGMILQAAADLRIDLANSVVIGDNLIDIEAGHRAGVGHTFLVLTGHGRLSAEVLHQGSQKPSAVYPDAAAALATAQALVSHAHTADSRSDRT